MWPLCSDNKHASVIAVFTGEQHPVRTAAEPDAGGRDSRPENTEREEDAATTASCCEC